MPDNPAPVPIPEVVAGPPTPRLTARTLRFLRNVLWTWLGLAVAMFAGLVLSPYMIRKLGEEGYGIWALVFALVEYYDLLDFGFRSAVVKYTAHYRATEEWEQLHTVLDTALVYFSLIGAIVLLATFAVFRSVHGLFQITPAYQPQFARLILLVGFSWALGAVCHSFNASLEGFQRFDLSGRTWIIYIFLRSFGCGVLLLLGYGLVPLGMMVVSSQVVWYVLNYLAFRKVIPSYHFDPRGAKLSMFARLARYGSQTLLANSSLQVVSQGPTTLIGHFLPTAFVGYYAIPYRLIQMSVDVTDRASIVSGSNSAEMTAKGETDTIARMGVLVSRYCLMIFMPVAVMLWVYRAEIIQAWIRKPAYVDHSAPVLPVLLLGAIFVLVGQANSTSILYGMGRQRGYACGLMIEACISVPLLYYVIPRYGILGAAVVATGFMILDRGIYLPWYLCRVLRISYGRYMTGIYVRPFVTAIPVVAAAYFLKAVSLPGEGLIELAAAGVIIVCLAWGIGFFTILDENHRSMFLNMAALRFGWVTSRFRGQVA